MSAPRKDTKKSGHQQSQRARVSSGPTGGAEKRSAGGKDGARSAPRPSGARQGSKLKDPQKTGGQPEKQPQPHPSSSSSPPPPPLTHPSPSLQGDPPSSSHQSLGAPSQTPSQGLGSVSAASLESTASSSSSSAAKLEPKKPLTKAERRAQQEAQRRSKAERQAAAGGGGGGKGGGGDSGRHDGGSGAGRRGGQRGGVGGGGAPTPRRTSEGKDEPQKPSLSRMAKARSQEMLDHKQVHLFSHLPQYRREATLTRSLDFSAASVHPAVVRVGLQYSEGVICGSNARCIAMLAAFKKVIQDYSAPEKKELRRDLDATIKPYINFLILCRPLSVSMGNAIKHLKLRISNIPPEMSESEAKTELCSVIDSYIHEKIILADEAISKFCGGVIKDGDVILTYAHSSIVQRSLLDLHKAGVNFRVIVVDSRPKLEGRNYLKQLVQNGVKCSYVLINAVSYIIKEVSKVVIGAHSLLANGYVMSRVGTSLIALVARSFNVPVLVCCETYKFCDKVQTDAFVLNELGDPEDLIPIQKRRGDFLSEWKSLSHLSLLNLAYDVTSPDLIAMVITEFGIIPCSSVPVVLRITRDLNQL